MIIELFMKKMQYTISVCVFEAIIQACWRTDKAPSISSAFKKLQNHRFYLHTEHQSVNYLNNLVEQDHRPITRRNEFYRSLRTAATTIEGIDTIRGLYKKSRKERFLFGFSVSIEIKRLSGTPV